MSCGKCHAQRVNLIGKRFGKLVVKEEDSNYIPSKENGWKYKVICECDCGNKISVFSSNLTRLHTISCGCLQESIGEANITQLLIENHIIFSKEFIFSDLRDKKPLRFDFAIFDENQNLIELVEFDGRQHNDEYNPWGGKETLEERQRRDNLKNEYCKKHNIKLVRIPYSKRDKICLEDIMGDEYAV